MLIYEVSPQGDPKSPAYVFIPEPSRSETSENNFIQAYREQLVSRCLGLVALNNIAIEKGADFIRSLAHGENNYGVTHEHKELFQEIIRDPVATRRAREEKLMAAAVSGAVAVPLLMRELEVLGHIQPGMDQREKWVTTDYLLAHSPVRRDGDQLIASPTNTIKGFGTSSFSLDIRQRIKAEGVTHVSTCYDVRSSNGKFVCKSRFSVAGKLNHNQEFVRSFPL